MRFLSTLLFLAACGATSHDDASLDRFATQTGTLQNSDISEASGLARSNRDENILWAINDSGSIPTLYALDKDGGDRGSVRLYNVNNVDWETWRLSSQAARPGCWWPISVTMTASAVTLLCSS